MLLLVLLAQVSLASPEQSLLSPLGQLGLGGGLAGLAIVAVKVLHNANAKTLELERQRVADLTESLRRRNESIDDRISELTEALRKRNEFAEEKLVPALVSSTEAVRAVLEATRRDHQ